VLDVLSHYPSLLGMLVISKLALAYTREKLSIYGMSKVLLFEKLPLQWRSLFFISICGFWCFTNFRN
jgi:hypothetical protein